MAKFTPGPWKVEHTTNGTTPYRITKRGVARSIATIQNNPNDLDDAFLIASAPNLYEACKLARRLADEDSDYRLDPYEVYKVLDKAIARAEGR